jgi:hypothetical protein
MGYSVDLRKDKVCIMDLGAFRQNLRLLVAKDRSAAG